MRSIHSLVLTLLMVLSTVVQAADSDALNVGLRINPPFVQMQDGNPTGLAVELWDEIARKLDRPVEYRTYDNVQALLDASHKQQIDVGVAAITVTAERSASVDFTHPYFRGGIGIATTSQSSWGGALMSLVSGPFVKAVGILLLVLLAVGVLVWLAERKHNAEQFGGKSLNGIGNGLWWSAVTMTTVGYGDKAPVTFSGRIIALVWMFVSIITISSFTAAIATAFTVERLSAQVNSVDDLSRVRVATLASTTSAEALRDRGISFSTVGSIDEGMQGLSSGRFDALVYDAPVLAAALLNGNYADVLLLPQKLREEDYAFALPVGSPLRKPINEAMLEMLRSEQWPRMLTRYLGEQ